MSLNPVSMDWFGDCSNGPQLALVICVLCMPSSKGLVGMACDGLFRPHASKVSSTLLFSSLAIHVVTLLNVRRPSGHCHECVYFGKDRFLLYPDHRVVPSGGHVASEVFKGYFQTRQILHFVVIKTASFVTCTSRVGSLSTLGNRVVMTSLGPT